MSFPVLIEPYNGQFAASLMGVPNVRVVEPTRSQAIDALKEKIWQSIQRGELLSLEVDVVGISSLASKYEKDPTLREICEDAYQIRDTERVQ
jgi:hypothetical protein